MKKFAFLALGISLSLTAFAGSAVGKYTGKLNIDFSPVKNALKAKAAKNANMKSQLDQQLAMIDAGAKALADATVSLELKKDGSLTMKQNQKGKDKSETGKWSQSGNTIHLTGLSTTDGGPKELTGTMSKDGKSIVFNLDAELKKQMGKNTQAAGMGSPTGNLTFKKV